LNVDKKQGYLKANILVPISRPAKFSDLVLLTPLWPNGDMLARKKFLEKFHRCLQHTPDYRAEMERLNDLHEFTMDAFSDGPTYPPRSGTFSKTASPTPTPPTSIPPISTQIPTACRPELKRNATILSNIAIQPNKYRNVTQSHTLPIITSIETLPTRQPVIETIDDITIVRTFGVPRILTSDRWFNALHRIHFGPESTSGDGCCAIHAAIQTTLRGTLAPICSRIYAKAYAEENVGELRIRVKDAIFARRDLQTYFTELNCQDILLDADNDRRCSMLRPYLGRGWKAIATLFGLRYKNQGIWYNHIAIRCMAITLDQNIVVIDMRDNTCLVVYPRKFGAYHIPGNSRSFPCHMTAIHCQDDNGQFIPSFAFDAETIVLAYNGTNHFWYTELAPNFTEYNNMNVRRVVNLVPMP